MIESILPLAKQFMVKEPFDAITEVPSTGNG